MFQAHTRAIKCFKPDSVVIHSVSVLLSVDQFVLPLCKMFYIFQKNLLMSCHSQKDAGRAVFVAITSRSVFELDDGEDVCSLGVAHPLLLVNNCITNWAIYSKLKSS